MKKIEKGLEELISGSTLLLREVKSKYQKVAVLWSMGKESTAIISLIREAFLGKVPFPVIHVDNGIDFPETYKFRDSLVQNWDLELIVEQCTIQSKLSGFSCCGSNKTVVLRNLMGQYGFDALIVSIGRGEDEVRAKEERSLPREGDHKWLSGGKPSEFWNDYYQTDESDGYVRVHPILNWNEIYIWKYTLARNIPVNPLYYSVNGYRYRRIGCLHCAEPVLSNVNNINGIIDELQNSLEEGRPSKEQDKEREYAMEKLRQLGYM